MGDNNLSLVGEPSCHGVIGQEVCYKFMEYWEIDTDLFGIVSRWGSMSDVESLNLDLRDGICRSILSQIDRLLADL